MSSSSAASSATGPLAGLRVIDMSTVLAAPLASQILADYGADVIKVEPPGGDVFRHAGAKRNPLMGPVFMHANRNKRSAVIDARDRRGRDAILRLCRGAHGFLHNIRPAAMARLGLSYEDVARVSPAIVYLNLVGYGSKGCYAGRPAYDDLIQGFSGLAATFTMSGADEPRFVPMVIADRLAGLGAAHAMLAALVHQQRTGEGQQVEVPMFESLVQMVLGDHLGGLSFQPPAGPKGYARLTTRNRRPYRTRDGYICVLVYTDRQWQKFFGAIGRRDIWDSDPRFADQATRAQHYDDAYGMLAGFLTERTTAEWLELLHACDLPAVPVSEVEDLVDDPHLRETGFLATVEHPTEGSMLQIGVPQNFSATPANIYRHAPRPGEQSLEVLAEAGLAGEEIDALIAAGVVGGGEARPARGNAPSADDFNLPDPACPRDEGGEGDPPRGKER
jgi:crotonobetainyl-CoA:carnitine CoA-transferase CaiB-like acyl-CoA transferase